MGSGSFADSSRAAKSISSTRRMPIWPLGQKGGGTESFSCLQLLNCLRLKINFMLKRHIWGDIDGFFRLPLGDPELA